MHANFAKFRIDAHEFREKSIKFVRILRHFDKIHPKSAKFSLIWHKFAQSAGERHAHADALPSHEEVRAEVRVPAHLRDATHVQAIFAKFRIDVICFLENSRGCFEISLTCARILRSVAYSAIIL